MRKKDSRKLYLSDNQQTKNKRKMGYDLETGEFLSLICIGGCSQRLVESKDLINCPLEMTLIQKQKYAYRVLSEKLERI